MSALYPELVRLVSLTKLDKLNEGVPQARDLANEIPDETGDGSAVLNRRPVDITWLGIHVQPIWRFPFALRTCAPKARLGTRRGGRLPKAAAWRRWILDERGHLDGSPGLPTGTWN